MPVYEYVNTETGEVVEILKPVAERDWAGPALRRITVPRKINVVFGVLEEQHPERAVPKAFKDLEQTMNHREIARQTGFSTEKVKQIWGIK